MHRVLRTGGSAVSSSVRCRIRVKDPWALFYGTRSLTCDCTVTGPGRISLLSYCACFTREPRVWLRAIDFFWLSGAHLLLPFHIVSLITLSAMMSMLTLTQWSVGRRIWKNESLEWQFCYKLIFIDLGLIQDPVKHGKTQPLPWAKLGPKGLESWQVSQVPCLYHLCPGHMSAESDHTWAPGTLTFFIAPERRGWCFRVLSVCQMDCCIFYLHWNVPSDIISDLIHL